MDERRRCRAPKSRWSRSRALGARADVLVLDEPTASLPHDEVETLFAVRDGGTLWIMLDLNHRMAM